MSYHVRVTQHRFHTRLTVSGAPDFEQLRALVHVLGLESDTWEHEVLLADLRQVTSDFTPEQQAALGEATATSLLHLRRIASLVPAQRITRISEMAARRCGSNVCVFADEEKALAWLRQGG